MTLEYRASRPVEAGEYWLKDTSVDGRDGTGTSLRVRALTRTESLAEQCLEYCGITRVADVTGLDTVGIPVFHSVRPKAAPGLNTVTSGKGTTVRAARVSAMMEAIERTWCETGGASPRTGTYTDLVAGGKLVLDPRRLIPRRGHTWSAEQPMGWWPTRELFSDREVLLPALSILTPYPHEHGMLSSNTIGLAIGNSPREALLHGLLEVVEHDCVAFGEMLRSGHRVPTESLPPVPAELVARFEQAGVEVRILLYRTEVGVPTFQVTTADMHTGDGMLFTAGAGCHLDPEVAVTRALTEAAQARLNVIAGAREDFDRQAYRRDSSYEKLREEYEEWTSGREDLDFDQVPDRSTGDVTGDLDLVFEGLDRIDRAAVFAAELAPPELPFSTTKVVVPGLEVFHEDRARLGPRLHRKMTKLDLVEPLT